MKTSIKKIIISVCLTVMTSVLCNKADGQVLAVKTNALQWGALTPNLGFELVTGEHTSLEISAFGHKNPYNLTSRVLALQPEFRYWFNGRPMTREFVGVTALLTTYKSHIPEQIFGKGAKDSPEYVHDGDAAGLGITGGYAFHLGKRFNLELSCGLGVVCFRQNRYLYQEVPSEPQVEITDRPNSWGYKLIPVDLGITFTYILK